MSTSVSHRNCTIKLNNENIKIRIEILTLLFRYGFKSIARIAAAVNLLPLLLP